MPDVPGDRGVTEEGRSSSQAAWWAALGQVRDLLDYLPANNMTPPPHIATVDDPTRATPELAEIVPADLPESLREETTAPAEFVFPPHWTLAEIEKMAILQTLQRTNWNKQEAAAILGLYRPTLYSKMKKHEIRDMGRAARQAAAAEQ